MTTTPNLSDLLEAAIDAHTSEWHTGMPGKVVSFDRATKTATIEPLIQAYDPELGAAAPRPVIPRVPVVYPSGGGFRLVFDLVAGDRVWLSFASRSLDAYRADPTTQGLPTSQRRFSLADAVAHAGFNAANSPAPEIEIRSEGGKLYMGSAAVDIVGELKALADIVALVADAVPILPQKSLAEALAARVATIAE